MWVVQWAVRQSYKGFCNIQASHSETGEKLANEHEEKNEVLNRKKQEKLENMLSCAQGFKGYLIKINVGVSSDLQDFIQYLNLHFLVAPGNSHKMRKLVFLCYVSWLGFPNHVLLTGIIVCHQAVNVSQLLRKLIINRPTTEALERDPAVPSVKPPLGAWNNHSALSRVFLAVCTCTRVFLLQAIKTAGYFSFTWAFLLKWLLASNGKITSLEQRKRLYLSLWT